MSIGVTCFVTKAPLSLRNNSIYATHLLCNQRKTTDHTVFGRESESYILIQMDNSNFLSYKLEFDGFVPQKTEANLLSYPLGSLKGPERGRCVILNYEQFLDPKKVRVGTEYDVKALKKTFEALNFQVIIHHDLTKLGTKMIIENESKLDHKSYHCFVMCVLSHGDANKFQCIEGEGIEYESLFAQFNAKKCPSLNGKPKLFFIQACQGEVHDNGVPLSFDSTTSNFRGNSQLQLRPDNPLSKPITADQFVFYCSYPNYFSIRNPFRGSWFMESLTQVLDDFSADEDLHSMAIRVQRNVSDREAAMVNEQGQTVSIKQMPLYNTTLLKKVFFY